MDSKTKVDNHGEVKQTGQGGSEQMYTSGQQLSAIVLVQPIVQICPLAHANVHRGAVRQGNDEIPRARVLGHF